MPRTLLVALVMLLSAVAGWGQFRTVTVQNANSNPVPTSIQNTPNVNIANTPAVTISGTPAVSVSGTVSAAITGTPSVSVTGTPAVSVSNLPTGTAGPANTTGMLTKNLDEPARQPFHQLLTCSTLGTGSCNATYTVPAGKRLVIEYFTVAWTATSGAVTASYQVTTTVQGVDGVYQYLTVAGASDHLVRIYADAASLVGFTGSANSATGPGTVNFQMQFSGYFVSVP